MQLRVADGAYAAVGRLLSRDRRLSEEQSIATPPAPSHAHSPGALIIMHCEGDAVVVCRGGFRRLPLPLLSLV